MSRLDRALRLAVVLVLLALRPADAVTPLPGDTMVYGEQTETFRDGTTTFPSSGGAWDYQQLPSNPVTRPKFRAVANLENAVDTYANNIGAFGKYVFVGNGQSPGLGGESSGLTMGVFDSETKQYCNLPIDPSVPSTNRHMIVGNPGKRQSRIIYAPVARGITGEPAFGYVRANLDQDNPCTSWTVVSVTAQELDGAFPLGEQLCPQGLCEYDSVTLLAHQDVAGAGNEYGIDWIALGDYFSGNIALIRIQPSDPQGIRDTGIKVMDTIKPQPFTAPGGVGCYVGIGAARLAAADVQRIAAGQPAPTNLRFTFSFDAFNSAIYGPNGEQPAPACPASPVRYCPQDLDSDGRLGRVACDPLNPLLPCSPTMNCTKGFCALGFAACDTDAECVLHLPATCDSAAFDFPTGPCRHDALYKNRTQTCGYRSDGGTPSYRQCLDGFPPQCPNYPFESCWPPGNFAPSQEYKFNGTSISAVSPMFFSANGLKPGPGPSALEYDTDHSLWVGLAGAARGIYRVKVANESCNIDGQNAPFTVGEHCYYDDTPDLDHASVVLTDRSFTTQVTAYSGQTLQVGNTTYIADDYSVQQAVKFFGEWTPTAPTSYKVGLAYLGAGGTASHPLAHTSLPAEPIGCTTSHASCDTNADCPAACGTCDELGEAVTGVTLFPNFKPLRLGGSPPSLWTMAGYVTGPITKTATFLERVPTALYLDDNLSTVRPSVSWSGNRLWMVAEHAGQLKYRVRDDGVWGGWFPLGTEKIAAGGAAVVAGGAGVGVRIYARESGTNKLMEKRLLTSNLNCIPGSSGPTACTWLPWYNAPDIGGGITLADDPAATLVGTSQMAIAVRASNNSIYSIIDQLSFAASWGGPVGSLQTNAAPSISYHPPDGNVWIAARETSTGLVKVTSYPPGSPTLAGAWAATPTTGGPASTAGTAPGIVSDGTTIRLFGVEPVSAGWPWVWQIANDGSGWSNWRKPLGGSSATRQPVAANINGEIDLVTYWYTGGIQEAVLP